MPAARILTVPMENALAEMAISIAMKTWRMAVNRTSFVIINVKRDSSCAQIRAHAVMPVLPAVVRRAVRRVPLAVVRISALI